MYIVLDCIGWRNKYWGFGQLTLGSSGITCVYNIIYRVHSLWHLEALGLGCWFTTIVFITKVVNQVKTKCFLRHDDNANQNYKSACSHLQTWKMLSKLQRIYLAQCVMINLFFSLLWIMHNISGIIELVYIRRYCWLWNSIFAFYSADDYWLNWHVDKQHKVITLFWAFGCLWSLLYLPLFWLNGT